MQSLGAWSQYSQPNREDAGECRRGNWQVGLAAGFLELTPGRAEPRDPHVRGGPARREAGRDDRQEAREWRRSTRHQATFHRYLDSVMLIVHLHRYRCIGLYCSESFRSRYPV